MSGKILQGIPYQKTGERAQVECPHRIRNRAGNECAICGSLKQEGRWWYLSSAWFQFYMQGGPRPPAI